MNTIQAAVAQFVVSSNAQSTPADQSAQTELVSLPEDALDQVGGGGGGTNLL